MEALSENEWLRRPTQSSSFALVYSTWRSRLGRSLKVSRHSQQGLVVSGNESLFAMESSSSKRAKAPGNISQVVAHCLVDGCNADLNLCRDYHRRHKICQVHSKTAKVTIGGREQRFCQQCSRFHSLVEFDEGKRSCRKRLDGHNRRRRKPQPGPRLLSFNSKPENETMVYNQHHMNFYDHSYNKLGVNNNQIHHLLQGDNNLDPRNVVVDSDHALSLLSSGPTTRPESRGCLGQSSTSSSLATSSSSNRLNFPTMFQHGGEGQGSSATGSHQTLTFMWE